MSAMKDCDCNDFLSRLFALFDSELEAAEAEVLRAHVARCPDCTRHAEAEEHIRAILRRAVEAAVLARPFELVEHRVLRLLAPVVEEHVLEQLGQRGVGLDALEEGGRGGVVAGGQYQPFGVVMP